MPKHETPTAEVPLEDGAPPEPEKPPQASARLVNIMHRVLRKQQRECRCDDCWVGTFHAVLDMAVQMWC